VSRYNKRRSTKREKKKKTPCHLRKTSGQSEKKKSTRGVEDRTRLAKEGDQTGGPNKGLPYSNATAGGSKNETALPVKEAEK